MISRRSVWVSFFALILVEIFIGCQGTDLSPGSPVNSRPTGYGARGSIPSLTISDPPRTPVTTTPGEIAENPQSRLTDTTHLTDSPHLEVKPTSLGAADESTQVGGLDELHKLHDAVMDRAGQLESYIARFRRREVVKGKAQPEELICLKFRKQPWSVHMKWLRPDDAQGREVLYVKGRYENKMHIVIEKSMPILGGSKRSFDLNDAMVKGRSRHDITEAGIHEFVDRLHTVLAAVDRNDKSLGTLVYHGETKRPEFDQPVLLVEHVMPPGYESLLPQGGHRLIYIDQAEKLPMLVITLDERGQEVEYYCYDGLQANVKLDEADFNPANLVPARK